VLSELFSIWSSGDFTMLHVIFVLLSYAALILVSLPVHEFAHAFAAYKLGDETAKWTGRLSLNPMKHLDPFGTVMLLLCGFGYARPVPVNPRYFRGSEKSGMAITALAGPLSNLLMAILATAIYRLIALVCGDAQLEIVGYELYYSGPSQYMDLVYYAYLFFIRIFASINISLAVFNLLPIPPLDGSRIFSAILPDKLVYTLEQYERYITMGLFVLLLMGVLNGPLSALHHAFGSLICTVLGMPNIF